jgi:hypothetical protein
MTAALTGGLWWSALRAEAQPPKVGQKWEYASLEYEEPASEVGSRILWTSGKKVHGGRSEKFLLECVSKLNKELGGGEDSANIGQLLDRIGQNGWELVAHTKAGAQRSVTQLWTFKRPAN